MSVHIDPPPGMVVGLSQAGRRVVSVSGSRQCWAGAVSWPPAESVDVDRLRDPLPMSRQTVFDLASVTKVVGTATALARLMASGVLAWDDPVHRFVPAFGDGAKRAITIDDLLHHRAGLWEWRATYLEALPDDVRRLVCELPLRYAPQAEWHYSDLGLMVAGWVIEAATGQLLDAAIAELVAGPMALGVTYRPISGWGVVQPSAFDGEVVGSPPDDIAATDLGDRAEYRMVTSGVPYSVPGDAEAFDGWRRHVIVGEVGDGNAFHSLGGIAGHAGLFGTVNDLLTWGEHLLADLDSAPNPTSSGAALLTPPDVGGEMVQGRGLRWRRHPIAGRSELVAFHTGFTGTGVAIVPRLRAVVGLGTNRLHVMGEPTATEPLLFAQIDALMSEVS